MYPAFFKNKKVAPMSDGKRSCKICHMGEMRGNRLCNPCKCSGTIKYIHKECLLSWMSCSRTERCDICHYEYKFRDVYKPDTPRVLPLSILIKGAVDMGCRTAVVLAWYFSQIAKWAGVFYINGATFLVSTGLCSRGTLCTSNCTLVCLVCGIPLTWLAQMHQYLFCQIQRKFGSESRRRMVINTRAVLESMIRDRLDAPGGEPMSGVDTGEGSQSVSRRDVGEDEVAAGHTHDAGVSSQGEQQEEQDEDVEPKDPEDEISEESGASTAREAMEFTGAEEIGSRPSSEHRWEFSLKAAVCGILSLTAPISFLPAMYAVSRVIPVYIPYPSFNTFLEQVDMMHIYSRLIGFGLVFWLVVHTTGGIRKNVHHEKLKFIHVFLKIYYIIFLNMFIMYLTFGLVIHYMFGNILNSGVYILDLKDEYGTLINGAVSLVFHMSIGYTFSMMIRNVCLKFKKYFRPGLLYFIPDDEDSKMDELYEASKTRTSEILFRITTYLVVFSMFYGAGFAAARHLCSGTGVRLSVRSLLKLSIVCKVFSVVLYSNDILGDYMVSGLNKVIKLQSRLLDMENFLYNTPMERYDRGRLMWCTNRDKLFRRQHVKAKQRRRPTPRDVVKHFGTNSSGDFAVFYVPPGFGLRCFLLVSTVVSSCYCFYAGYISMTKTILSRISVEEYLPNTDDILFYLVLGGLLRLSWILIHVSVRVCERRGFARTIGELAKYGIVNVYVNVLYPLFGSFILIMLSSDTLDFNTLRPLRLFLVFFSNTFVMETLVCGYILRSPPEHYTFRALVRELYKVNAFVSVLFGMWYLYNAVTLVLGLSNIEFVVLGVLVGYIVFITKKVNQSIGSNKSFYRRLLDENYLVERRVVNVDEDE